MLCLKAPHGTADNTEGGVMEGWNGELGKNSYDKL